MRWPLQFLSPDINFEEKLLSNVRLFLTVYQYLMLNNVFMNNEKYFTVYEQIKSKLYNGENLENNLDY